MPMRGINLNQKNITQNICIVPIWIFKRVFQWVGQNLKKIRICPSNITHASMTLDKYVRLNSEKKRECQ